MARDPIGVGVIGYGWIARAHVHALHSLNHIAPLERPIRLVSMAGRQAERVGPVANELGFERWTTSWEELVADDEVEVVAVAAANEVHGPASLAALELGKAVLCEKPLGLDAAEAAAMAAAAKGAGVTNACGFNYRFVPAVWLARELLESGKLGELRHYRALYLQDFMAVGGQTRSSHGGAGAVADYSHLVDMLRFLAGEPTAVSARTASFVSGNEDAFAASLELPRGALATLEASRCALGWKGRHRVEVNGTRGSLWWDMEDVNRLHVFLLDDEGERLGGFRDVLVTQPDHPFLRWWWAPGHVLGWEHSFAHQWREFLQAVLEERPVGPWQASFDDGFRAARICDAVLEAAALGRQVELGAAGGERRGETTGKGGTTQWVKTTSSARA
jgi:predicted dehydrogenase